MDVESWRNLRLYDVTCFVKVQPRRRLTWMGEDQSIPGRVTNALLAIIQTSDELGAAERTHSATSTKLVHDFTLY